MLFIHCLLLAFLSIPIAEGLASQQFGNDSEPNLLNSDVPLSVPAYMNLISHLNASSLTEWDSLCDAEAYGRNLDIDSCQQAFKSMSISARKATYRNRGDKSFSDYKLPMLTVSGAFRTNKAIIPC